MAKEKKIFFPGDAIENGNEPIDPLGLVETSVEEFEKDYEPIDPQQLALNQAMLKSVQGILNNLQSINLQFGFLKERIEKLEAEKSTIIKPGGFM